MKKMLLIATVLFILISCSKKRKCWDCEQKFTYPNGQTETFKLTPQCDLTEDDIKIKEQVNTYSDNTETSEYKCQEHK